MKEEDKNLLKAVLKKTSNNEIEKHIKALDYFTSDISKKESDDVVELFKSSYAEVQKKVVISRDIEFKDVPMAECVRKFLEEDEDDYWYSEYTQASFMTYKYFDVSKLDELIDDIDNEVIEAEGEYLSLVKEGAAQLANYLRLFGINRVFKYE